MAQRKYVLDNLGEIKIVKRRGAKNLALRVNPSGEVRISMPLGLPYIVGLAFAKRQQRWIIRNKSRHALKLLTNGSRIGKAHRLTIIQNPIIAKPASIKIVHAPNCIEVRTNLSPDNKSLQNKILKACEAAIIREAKQLLPQRLNYLADKYKLSFKEVGIKKLSARWGSCSPSGNITLNCFLMQLPWELIDYVLVHELTHLDHPNHSQDFWQSLEQKLPNTKQLRKQLRGHHPSLQPV